MSRRPHLAAAAALSSHASHPLAIARASPAVRSPSLHATARSNNSAACSFPQPGVGKEGREHPPVLSRRERSGSGGSSSVRACEETSEAASESQQAKQKSTKCSTSTPSSLSPGITPTQSFALLQLQQGKLELLQALFVSPESTPRNNSRPKSLVYLYIRFYRPE